MFLDGLTVAILATLAVMLLAITSAAIYALRMLRRTEDVQLTALRDIVRVVYHGR